MQAHLETLSHDNAKRRAELNSLRARLNGAATSEQHETLYNATHNASLPKDAVMIPTHGLHRSILADITASNECSHCVCVCAVS